MKGRMPGRTEENSKLQLAPTLEAIMVAITQARITFVETIPTFLEDQPIIKKAGTISRIVTRTTSQPTSPARKTPLSLIPIVTPMPAERSPRYPEKKPGTHFPHNKKTAVAAPPPGDDDDWDSWTSTPAGPVAPLHTTPAPLPVNIQSNTISPLNSGSPNLLGAPSLLTPTPVTTGGGTFLESTTPHSLNIDNTDPWAAGAHLFSLSNLSPQTSSASTPKNFGAPGSTFSTAPPTTSNFGSASGISGGGTYPGFTGAGTGAPVTYPGNAYGAYGAGTGTPVGTGYNNYATTGYNTPVYNAPTGY